MLVYSSNPNQGEYISPIEWKPTTPKVPKYMEIDKKPKIGDVLFPNRYDIWDECFPLNEKCPRHLF